MKSCRELIPAITLGACVLCLTVAAPRVVFAYPQEQSQLEGRETGVVQVEAKYVCMINNQRFDKEQIAIEVEGRTYYGCCEMCKERLGKDSRSRTALDPVSGKRVDKAKAVIGADSDGKVFYFENVENLKRFKAGSSHGDHKK